MAHPVAVIGAGPYGLSTAAHLRALGIPVRVFGDPMVSWRSRMPAGMLLKSTPAASDIDAPQRGHRLIDYCDAAGIPRLVTDEDIVPVETFVRYGLWFAERLVPDLEQVRVVAVDRAPAAGRGATAAAGFVLKLDSGEQFTARAVVVATGLTGAAHLPPGLAEEAPAGGAVPPAAGVSRSSQHSDLASFAGRDLIVVGAGQSALESAVLAAEAGARVRIVSRTVPGFGGPPSRQPRLRPRSPFGRAWSLYAISHHAGLYRCLPAGVRHHFVHRILGPLGAWWLRERFEGAVQVSTVRGIEGVTSSAGRPVLAARTEDGTTGELTADHVIAATGYRVDLAALDWLGHEVRAGLATSRGTPRLGAGYRSSVPGLYFTGLPAAASYGPVMRFVCGTSYASPRLARQLAAAHP
ncbi:NAD(P)/FAD-dependent oxidoreductase [Streptomyces triticagri]|uniref:NAD(P)/FAD-dependent oxidoreductase n=1 Tax=Streptomyces triticagri TaxID=2293568 RepID=A0A372MA13_9ACTN|nr:FAD-dependent oxidoreductase [Streptomyces triticagri]RFU87731.1 NAD(P)/FAD-dependent oxidoreductase [Streptomyces triticagri]